MLGPPVHSVDVSLTPTNTLSLSLLHKIAFSMKPTALPLSIVSLSSCLPVHLSSHLALLAGSDAGCEGEGEQ